MNNGYQPINAKLLSDPPNVGSSVQQSVYCGNCIYTDGMCYYSNPSKVKCTITGEYHYYTDRCNCKRKIKLGTVDFMNQLPNPDELDKDEYIYVFSVGKDPKNLRKYVLIGQTWTMFSSSSSSEENNSDRMTIDKLIEICKREYERGMHTAGSSKFDEGYSHAMRLCLSFARELKESMKGDE